MRYTKLLYSVSRNNLITVLDSRRTELTKVYEFLCVSLMYGSNVNYCVMGGDVGKVFNGAQQVKILLFILFFLASQ